MCDINHMFATYIPQLAARYELSQYDPKILFVVINIVDSSNRHFKYFHCDDILQKSCPLLYSGPEGSNTTFS